MKRISVILLMIALISVLTACGQEQEATVAPTAAPQPQLHTVAPTTAAAEPEWAPVDCDLELVSGGQAYADRDDFECFALSGSDDSAVILMKLSDAAAHELSSLTELNEFSVTVDGEEIGGADLSDDCKQVTLKGDYTYEELCELATRIRGL